jgi:hypothetical protein
MDEIHAELKYEDRKSSVGCVGDHPSSVSTPCSRRVRVPVRLFSRLSRFLFPSLALLRPEILRKIPRSLIEMEYVRLDCCSVSQLRAQIRGNPDTKKASCCLDFGAL